MSRETHKRKYYLYEEKSASEGEVVQPFLKNILFAEFPLFQLPKQVFIYIFASYLTAQDFLLFRKLNKAIRAKLESTLTEPYFQKKIATVFPGNYPETKVTAIDRYKNLIESVLNIGDDNTVKYRKIFNYIAENDSKLAMKEFQDLGSHKIRESGSLSILAFSKWRDQLCIGYQTSTGINLINWAVKFSRREFLDNFFKVICQSYFSHEEDEKDFEILINVQSVEDLKTEMATSGMSNSVLSTYSLAFVCLQKSICEEIRNCPNWDASYVDECSRSLLTYALLLRSPELFSHVIQDLSEEKACYLLSTRAEFTMSVIIGKDDSDFSVNPLELACFLDVSTDFIKLILSFNGGIERYEPDELGEYLHWCISKRNLKAMIPLLIKGVDPNTITRLGSSWENCLVKAVQVESTPILRLLLNYNAHIPAEGECQGDWYIDPLLVAVDKLSVDAVSCLLERGASVNGYGQCDEHYTLIERAIFASGNQQLRLAVVKLLAAKKPENIGRAINFAIKRGDLLIAKFLSTISPVNYEHFRHAALHSFAMLVAITSDLPRSEASTWLYVVWCEAMIAHSCALILRRGGGASPFLDQLLDQLTVMQDLGVIRKLDNGEFNTSGLTDMFYNGDEKHNRKSQRERYHLFLKRVHRFGKKIGIDSTNLQRLTFFTSDRSPWTVRPSNSSIGATLG